MTAPVFMSVEHVDQMNGLLAASAEVAGACQALDRPYVLHYHLTDGPDDGAEVHWTMTFAPDGIRFGLTAPERAADLLVAGDWREILDMTQAGRQGRAVEPLPMVGAPGVLERITPAFLAAQAVATVEVVFPS